MIRIATAIAIFIFGFISTADAKSYHHYQHHYYPQHHSVQHIVKAHNVAQGLGYGLIHMMQSANVNDYDTWSTGDTMGQPINMAAPVAPMARPVHGAYVSIQRPVIAYSNSSGGVRPADCYGIPWCGCFVRHKLGIADTAYNWAPNWFKWGHSSGPCVGCVAVSYHHVALIVGQSEKGWIVEQGNPYYLGPMNLSWASAYRSP